MSFEFFFVLELDNETKALTTSFNQVEVFDGVEYTFREGVISSKIPPNRVNPFSSGGRAAGTVEVQFFDEGLMPGHLLQTYAKIQGCPVKCWVKMEDGTKRELFSGEVQKVSYNLEKRSITVTAGAPQRNVLIPFPPASTLEEGRFVNRAVYHFNLTGDNVNPTAADKTRLPGTSVWLRDRIYFTTQFGSPVAPLFQPDGVLNGSVQAEFLQTDITALMENSTSTIVQDPEQKTYLWWENSARDEAIPIIYGEARNMSLAPLAHYRVKARVHFNNDVFFQYYKIYIYPIACHRILGDPRPSFNSNTSSKFTKFPDFWVALRWGDDQHMEETWSEGGIGYYSLGYFVQDGLNHEVAYTTLAVKYTNSTFEEIDTLNNRSFENFDPSRVYASNVRGRLRSTGESFNRLGNVIEDMWLTFGGGVGESIDWDVVSRYKDRLNQYTVDLVLNERQKQQTLDRILSSRVSQSFPITFTSPRGKLAWICTSLPLNVPSPVRHLELNVELSQLKSLKETDRSKVINDISLSYGVDGKRTGQAITTSLNRHNSEICRASYDRWGPSQRKQINCPDTQSSVTANLIASEVANLSAGVRLSVMYRCYDITVTDIPIMSVITVTDEMAGFDEEEFWFLGYLYSADMSSIQIELLSVNML